MVPNGENIALLLKVRKASVLPHVAPGNPTLFALEDRGHTEVQRDGSAKHALAESPCSASLAQMGIL
jgi:hypothetical protein